MHGFANSLTAEYKTLPNGIRSRRLVPFAQHRAANAPPFDAKNKISHLVPLGRAVMARILDSGILADMGRVEFSAPVRHRIDFDLSRHLV